MWGFYSRRDRSLADSIFRLVNDTQLKAQYNGPKGNDQFFLGAHVYGKIRENSIIHDSYLCGMYRDSEPYPTQRVGFCHIGLRNENCTNESNLVSICPPECRLVDHKDWEKC
jgi:hypothetical protein